MNDFPNFDDIENMGGNLESFSFQSTLKISSIANTFNGKITTAVVFTGSNVWLKGKSLQNTLDFNEPMEKTAAGDIYKTSIKGYVPKLTPEVLTLFAKMTKAKHIVLSTDSNGNARLSGEKFNGLTFVFERNSSATPSGASGHKFEFYGQFTKASPFYVI